MRPKICEGLVDDGVGDVGTTLDCGCRDGVGVDDDDRIVMLGSAGDVVGVCGMQRELAVGFG